MDDAQRQRSLKAALKAFVARSGSQHIAAEALGYTQARLSQIIADDLPISMRLANALASAEGTTLDGLARQERVPDLPARQAVSPSPSPRVEFADEPATPRTLAEAIDAALDKARGHTYVDGRAVELALGETFQFEAGADVVGAVTAWLDAARNIRRRGLAVTTQALLAEVTLGRSARARQVADERDDAVNAEADAGVDELGLIRRDAPPSDRPIPGTEGMPSRTVGPDAGSGIHREPSGAAEALATHGRRLGIQPRKAR